MRYLLILILLTFFLIVSCITSNATVPTYPLNNYLPEKPVVKVLEQKIVDPCEGVVCSEKKHCSDGVCKCNVGLRSCGGECIPVEQCCTSSDCNAREVCKNNFCEQVEYCDFNQEWNEKTKKCDCVAGTYWCAEQKSCIPMNNCCDARSCNGEGLVSKLCVPSIPEPYVCIKTVNGSHCRRMPEGKRTSFSLPGENGDIFVNRVFENGVTNFKIVLKGKEYLLNNVAVGKDYFFAEGKLKLTIKKVSVKGGFCTG